MGQLNVRIEDSLKQRGDRVFQEHGLTPSVIIRAVWQYAADNKELPAFIREANEEEAQKKEEQKRLLAEAGAGMATRLLGIPPLGEDYLSYKDLRELAYQAKLEGNEY